MEDQQLDTFSKHEHYNNFDEKNELKISEYGFLPSIQMTLLGTTTDTWNYLVNDPDMDIFDDDVKNQ